MCLPELFKELFAILFVCDGKNDDLFWMDSIINSKNTASQTIKWRVKVCQFFYPGFTKWEWRCFQIDFYISRELESFISFKLFNVFLSRGAEYNFKPFLFHVVFPAFSLWHRLKPLP